MLTELPDLNIVISQVNQLNDHHPQALAPALYASSANINYFGRTVSAKRLKPNQAILEASTVAYEKLKPPTPQ